jgi:hypothetical protein
MMARNKWVHDFLLEELDRSEYRGEGFFYPYSLLPSYERILYTFWVFDFYKFYPKEYQTFLRLRAKKEEKPEVHSL